MNYEQFFYWLDGYVTNLNSDIDEIKTIKEKILTIKNKSSKNLLNEFYSRSKELGTINITLNDDEDTTYNP